MLIAATRLKVLVQTKLVWQRPARKFRTGGLNISPRVRHFGNFRARIVVN